MPWLRIGGDDVLRRDAATAILPMGAALGAVVQPLGWPGRVAALLLYVAVAAMVMRSLDQHQPHRRFGPANLMTLARAAAVALLFGIYAEARLGQAISLDSGLRWPLAGLALIALLLDGIDGALARRFRTASDFGARFDMEIDALLVLALSLLVHAAGQAGLFVLASGLMRYAYVAAGRIWPALRRPLPPSLRRKTVCVLQTAALILALSPLLLPAASAAVCAIALVLLSYSFAADCIRQLGEACRAAAAIPY